MSFFSLNLIDRDKFRKAKELGLGFAPMHGIIGDFNSWGKAKDESNTFVRIMEVFIYILSYCILKVNV